MDNCDGRNLLCFDYMTVGWPGMNAILSLLFPKHFISSIQIILILQSFEPSKLEQSPPLDIPNICLEYD